MPVFDVRFSACCWRFLQAADGNLRASADINFFFLLELCSPTYRSRTGAPPCTEVEKMEFSTHPREIRETSVENRPSARRGFSAAPGAACTGCVGPGALGWSDFFLWDANGTYEGLVGGLDMFGTFD